MRRAPAGDGPARHSGARIRKRRVRVNAVGGGEGSGDGQLSAASHWDRVYRENADVETSWYEVRPDASLSFIRDVALQPGARVLDVGGGRSRLVDHLLEAGLSPGVLDVSAQALVDQKRRLGPRAHGVEWIEGDVASYRPAVKWDLWHDRALLHFLTGAVERTGYVETVRAALKPGGTVVLGVFAPEGPERCSGLPVRRYGLAELQALFGDGFAFERAEVVSHRTPWGTEQQFQFLRMRRTEASR